MMKSLLSRCCKETVLLKRMPAALPILLLCLSGAGGVEQPPPEPPAGFPRSGEFLQFEVFWSGLSVGKVNVTNHGLGERSHQPCAKLEAYAHTTGAVDTIYTAKLRYLGYLRPDHTPWLYEEWEKEDDWRLTEWLEYNPAESLFKRYKKNRFRNELPVTKETFDPVSAAYHLLTLPLRPGDHYEIPVTEGKDLYVATADVRQGPVLETILGNVSTVEVTPHIYFKGKSLGERGYKAWFSSDKRRIPLKLFVDVEFGSFSADLIKYKPPDKPAGR
jgi:hypothetical protein